MAHRAKCRVIVSERFEKSYCRICSGMCGVVLGIDEQSRRIVSVKGDKDHPLSRGYVCLKGLQAPEAHYGADRLLHPLKRAPGGELERIELEQALDEIATKLRDVIDRDGPGAVAGYRGTINVYSSVASQIVPDWLHSIGSNAYYTTMTIDQSAKWVTIERLGAWMAGKQPIDDADVLLIAGQNPLVSISGPGLMHNPTKTLREAKARGMALIVIDPRRSETAMMADLHLQPRPGQDAMIAAGLLRVILSEFWHDAQFCEEFVDDLDGLREQLDPFTPALVARQSGLREAELIAAAELFAKPQPSGPKRGCAGTGTGVAMAAHCSLADHLYECMNVVCGRFLRVGEEAHIPGLFAPKDAKLLAGVMPPRRSWEKGWKSRIGGYGMLFGERMTAELADEILTPGAGRIRSLIIAGGNPVGAIPDQRKLVRALRTLELLVTIDPYLSTTAQLAHYVLPPKLFYEHADLLCDRTYEPAMVPKPVAMYTPALVPPPEGAELVEDWFVFWSLARRLGTQLVFDGVDLDMQTAPDMDDLHAILMRNSRVGFDELRNRRGELLDIDPVTVEPGPAGRFAVAPADVRAELAAVVEEAVYTGRTEETTDQFLLIPRRMREVSNTMYLRFPDVHRRMPFNPLWMHPEDLSRLGLDDDAEVELSSQFGKIHAVVKADSTMRPGVVAMTHGWGGLPDADKDEPPRLPGVSVSLLMSSSKNLDPISAMPQFSAVPVYVRARLSSS